MNPVSKVSLCGALLKRSLLPALLVSYLCGSPSAPAATIPVFPGQSIQTAINGGTAGDTVVIFEGTYNQDITVNKQIQLAKPQDANVVLGGNLTLSGLTSPYVLHDFTIGVDRSKTLTVQNCSEVILQDLNMSSAAGFTATGTPKLTVLRVNNAGGTGSGVANAATFETKNSTIGGWLSVTNAAKFETKNSTIGSLNLSQSNSILRQGTYGDVISDKGDIFLLGGTVSSLSASSTVKSGSAGTGDSTAVVFQANITGGFGSSVQRSWIGYSTIRNLAITAGTSHVIVGNDFDGRKEGFAGRNYAAGIYLSSADKVKIVNNVIRNYGAGRDGGSGGRGIWIEENTGQCSVFNNIISAISRGWYSGYYSWGPAGGSGVYIAGNRLTANPIIIKGNIFERLSEDGVHAESLAVYGAFANVTMSDNAVHKYYGWISGIQNGAAGVVATNTTELSSPVNWEPSTFFKLPSASALKNKGPNDARFNNFDGTRNDLGIWGGTQFDPDGRTTTKPVVFGFDITPDQILEGTATQVKLMNIGAVMIEP